MRELLLQITLDPTSTMTPGDRATSLVNGLRLEKYDQETAVRIRDFLAQTIKERDDYKRRFERLLDVFTWNEQEKKWTVHPYFHAWVNEAVDGLPPQNPQS